MKQMGTGFLLICLLTVLGACGNPDEDTDETWEDIKQEEEIVVGTPGTLYPASYYPDDSDELTGYDVEVMREVGKRLDVDVTFEELDFDSMFSSLQSGRIDVAPGELREDMEDQFTSSDPYKYSYTTMIVRSDDVDSFSSLEDLDGKTAGGAATTVYSDIAEKYGAEVKTYGNVSNDVYLQDVEKGRTDVVINDYYLQKLAIEALPELDVEIHPDLKFHPTDQRAVIDKDAHTLKQKINESLEDMKEDGTLTEISEAFFEGEDVSEKPDEDIQEIEGIE